MNVVEKEWALREENGLPPHHSVDPADVGFRFLEPSVPDPGFMSYLNGDYGAMEKHFSMETDIRSAVTLQDLPQASEYRMAGVAELLPPPKDGPMTAFLACDGNYFEKFGAKLLASIDGPAQVHLMDADPSYAREVIRCLGRPAGFSAEQPKADPAYYHSVRFIRWYEFMVKTGGHSCLLDVDALSNRPHTELPRTEVGMRLRPARLEPWNVCNASVCIGRANRYWKGVADYIYHFWKKNKLIWQIDQTALWAVWQKQKPDITVLGPREVDYDYRDDSIIWCNSGPNKFKKTDKTRTRFRA